MLRIYFGRENIDKERFIFDSLEPGKNGCKSYIIVPDQFTLEAERDLFDHLGIESLVDTEVLSMSRLGSRLLREVGGAKRTFIDKYGRHMILSSIAKQNSESFLAFRNLEGKSSFINMVNNFISEMKQNGFGPNDIEEISKELEEDSYTARKLSDLNLLFAEYEKRIEGKYTDSEDYIDLFLERINESKALKNSEIYIYGFDSFAPKALAIIRNLLTVSNNVNVVLTYDDSKPRDKELFSLTEIVIENLITQAKIAGEEYSKERIPEGKYSRKTAPSVKHIESELYAAPSKKAAKDECEGLTLSVCANIYSEAETAAAYALQLVRDEGYHYSDIKVICNDQDVRGPVLVRTFKEYGIDLFDDSSKDIFRHPITRYIVSFMDVISEKYRTETIIDGLKTGFGSLTYEEIADLENYVITYRIKGTSWKRPFTKGEKKYGLEELKRLDELRARAVEDYVKFEKIYKTKKTGEFIENLYKFLYDEIKLPDKIGEMIKKEQEEGRIDLASETAQIWGAVIHILDQILEIMGEEEFSGKEFKEMLKTGLSELTIGVLPPAKDGLLLGTSQRTRTGNLKALIVVGANEGLFPMDKPSPGLFGAEEKEMFAEKGAQILKLDSIKSMEENLAIYRNLSRPSEKLFISYSISDAEGASIKESGIVHKIKEIFPELEIRKDVLNLADDRLLINPDIAGIRHLTEAIHETSEGEELSQNQIEAISWLKENKEEYIKIIKEGLEFTNRKEDIGRELAEALYRKDIDKALSLSPSRLEKFSRCPFSHFILYGLKPEERRIFQVAPREIGDIYHECLMKITTELSSDGLPSDDPGSKWMKITREELRRFVTETVENSAKEYNEGLFTTGNEEAYRKERITDILDKAAWAVIEQVRAGQILDSKYEVGFGRGREIEPIEIDLGTGKAYIEGKIDRVDYLKNDRVKIIDYKTGNENFSVQEAEEGYRLQLMLYLEAAIEKKRKPAGVFYFKISDPMLNISDKKADPETVSSQIGKSFKLNGTLVNDADVIGSVAGDFSGYSPIVPIRINKEGEVVGTGEGNLLSEDEFNLLREKVADKVREIAKDLADGKIESHPMKTKETSACVNCDFKGICRFDTIFEGCRYNLLK